MNNMTFVLLTILRERPLTLTCKGQSSGEEKSGVLESSSRAKAMSRPSLLRRNSSISARIDEQGTTHQLEVTQESKANGRSKKKSEELFPATRPRPHEYQEVVEGVEVCIDKDNLSSSGDIDTDELEV